MQQLGANFECTLTPSHCDDDDDDDDNDGDDDDDDNDGGEDCPHEPTAG